MTLRDRIAALVEPLKAEEAQLTEQRNALQTQMDAINADLREVQKLLKVADPESYVTENGHGGASGKINQDAMNKVLRAMWLEPGLTFTVAILEQKTGLSNSRVKTALQHLRADGDVRMVGRVPKKAGQLGTAPFGFKIAEGAVPPDESEEQQPLPAPKAQPITKHISQAKVDEVFAVLMTAPGRDDWTRLEVKSHVSMDRSQVDFAFRILEERGKVAKVTEPKPGVSAHYKVVTDGG